MARLFYGWWIVLSSGVLAVLGAGCFYYGLSAFFLPLTEHFGWSRTLTSTAFSLHRLEGGVLAPIVGFLFDRVGPRRLVTVGVLLAGAGFLVLSTVDTFIGFAASVLIMSAGFSSGFSGVGMATVANWFVRRRTTALGLLMTGAGLGGIIVPGIAWAIEAFGWRNAALAVGLSIWCIGLPLSRLLRHRPEDIGLLPDGDHVPTRPTQAGSSGGAVPEVATEQTSSTLQAIRSRAFWLLAIASTLTMIAQSAVMVHLLPFTESTGVAPTVAASVVAALTVVSIAGRAGFGWLGDRLPKRHVLGLLYGLQTAGLVVLATLSEAWQLIPFLALYGPAYGGAVPLRASVIGECFGRRCFGAIQGLQMGCTSFGAMLGPVFAGWVFDTTGAYSLAFWVLAGITILATPVILAMPGPLRTAPAVGGGKPMGAASIGGRAH